MLTYPPKSGNFSAMKTSLYYWWINWVQFPIRHPRQFICDRDLISCGCPRGEDIARAKRLRRLGWFS